MKVIIKKEEVWFFWGDNRVGLGYRFDLVWVIYIRVKISFGYIRIWMISCWFWFNSGYFEFKGNIGLLYSD